MTIEQQATHAPAKAAPRKAQMLIGGEHVDALDGQADVDRAVEAAQKAFEGPYSTWSAAKRGRTLQKFADLAKKNVEELAQIDRENVGKPITSSRGEAFAVSLVL